jgi:cytoskeletal protein RodZ
VSIGATLSAARRRAGLTVGEVSERTRVRETIIAGIEHDDYAACGGDFYARGHIRAIAYAVDADPKPLIEEFDTTWGSSPEITAAAFRPAMPIRVRERRRVRWSAALVVLVLAILGFASYKFVSGVGNSQDAAAPAARQHSGAPNSPPSGAGQGSVVQSGVGQSGVGQSGHVQSPAASTPAATRGSAQPSPTPTPPPGPLTAAGVVAFGTGGAGTGDDPQNASLALGDDPAHSWHSAWYTTAYFGNLYAGTGLLVDMGRTVTISSVRVSLGAPGANLELRAGGTPVLADLPRVAAAGGAGGTVRFQLSAPARARYLLLWFTKLPMDSAGTYQASVWGITVQGRRLPS